MNLTISPMTTVPIFEEINKDDKKKYKKRARRKVFGKVGGLWDRARRFYRRTLKKSKENTN